MDAKSDFGKMFELGILAWLSNFGKCIILLMSKINLLLICGMHL
jgi:hypothetical protein